jgi:hypothetical protein
MIPTLPNPPPTVNASPINIKGKNATKRVNNADVQLGIPFKNNLLLLVLITRKFNNY